MFKILAEKYYYCKNKNMFWVFVVIIVFIAIIFSFINDLKITCINTYRAIGGKEKIKTNSIVTLINLTTVIIVLFIIFHSVT